MLSQHRIRKDAEPKQWMAEIRMNHSRIERS